MIRSAGLLPLALTLCASAANWTDRAEYDLVLSIRAEGTVTKQVALLDQWKAKYPNSDMRQVRRELYLSAYESTGDSVHMLETVREMLAEQPDNPVATYWCVVLVPGAKDASPETWKLAESAAQRLMTNPSAAAQKASANLLAHRTLGWIEWQRADYAAAATDFTAYLKAEPKSAEISAWYGMALAAQKKPETTVPAIWHLTRAASLKGAGALADSQRRQVDALAERIYTNYHGEADGLDAIRTASLTAAFPPDTFAIESAESIAARKAEEELQRTNPQLAQWMQIRKHLEANDSDKYFNETLKTAALPKLKATVIACTPTEILLALSNGVTAEVSLKPSTNLKTCADAGAEIQFTATVDSYTKSPFHLNVIAAESDLEGWPIKSK